ncbi:MAG: hypothetical protein AAGA92_16200 [Planctomycetota bacterium]
MALGENMKVGDTLTINGVIVGLLHARAGEAILMVQGYDPAEPGDYPMLEDPEEFQAKMNRVLARRRKIDKEASKRNNSV